MTIHIQIKFSEAKDDETESSSEPSGPPNQTELGTSTQKSNSSKWKVIKTCLTEIYSVFVTLFGKILRNHFNIELISIISVTLSVFPGVCASIQSSSDDDFSQKWFSPILTMLLYNFGDTLGRLATAMIQINKRTNSFKIWKIEILSQIIWDHFNFERIFKFKENIGNHGNLTSSFHFYLPDVPHWKSWWKRSYHNQARLDLRYHHAYFQVNLYAA